MAQPRDRPGSASWPRRRPPPPQDASWPLHRDEQEGFALRYPPRFVAGAYRNDLPPDLVKTLRTSGGRLPFERALVLVEAARLGSRDRAALPVGEITAITIEAQAGPAAAARRDLGRQIYGAAGTLAVDPRHP